MLRMTLSMRITGINEGLACVKGRLTILACLLQRKYFIELLASLLALIPGFYTIFPWVHVESPLRNCMRGAINNQ